MKLREDNQDRRLVVRDNAPQRMHGLNRKYRPATSFHFTGIDRR